MGENHKVRFEPVGIEIDADEDETVLNAAFRQGVTLIHGCKEGQCSACKSFLLDGDLQMDRYSTFALADYESEEGYVLLCRSHAYSDLEIELVNYDEDMIRSGLPVVTVEGEVESLRDLTHDISMLTIRLDDDALRFHAGQYVDIAIPGSDEHRSFSMANTPTERGRLEFIIKRYPGGRFSGLLEQRLAAGDRLRLNGPYGTFTLRVNSDRRLVFVGGGAGMAPILALLRQMVESGNERPCAFYYGARTERDLFALDEIARIGAALPDFRFVPCLSERLPDDWESRPGGGAAGLVTDVVDQREADLDDCDFYLCGPPPMVDAALGLLEGRGVPQEQIFYDKFTTTAAAAQ